MALASQPRAFFRTGVEEEEITPPCKQRSFDSLSVAHILQAKLDTSDPAGGFGEGGFGRSNAGSATSPAASSSPGSPSIGDAAALLSRVQAGSTLDNAADCLLSLAMLSGGGHDLPRRAPPSGGRGAMKPPKLPSTSKRPHASMKGSNKTTSDLSQTNAARRRLKMAKPAADGFGDAAAQNASPQAGGIEGGAASAPPRSAARGSGGAAATKGRSNGGGRAPKTQRPRSLGAGQAASAYYRAQQHPQQQPLGAYYVADAGAAAVSNNTFTVSGVSYPIRLLSGASLEQLKCLSAAFQLCPHPNPQQIAAIGRRVGLPSEKLETWFQSRRTLQDWMLQQPQMAPSDLAGMFYPDETQASRSASSLAGAMPPSSAANGGDSSSATVSPPPPAHGVAGAAPLAAEWQMQAA